MRPIFVLFACAFAWSIAPAARADAQGDAKVVFSRARELRAHGDCAAAAPLFRRAWEAFPAGLGSLRNLAECETTIGHYASARRAWLDLTRALLAEHDPKYAGWDADASRAAQELAGKVAVLTVDVRVSDAAGEGPANEASNVTVLLDGERIPLAMLRTPLERDPGRHVVRAQGERLASAVQRTVDVLAGQSESITLAVRVPAGGRATLPTPLDARPAAPARADSSGSGFSALGWIAAGAGVLALGAGAVSFGVRQDALGELERSCPRFESAPCDPSVAPTVARGHAAATAATVLVVGGTAALAGGIVVLALVPALRVRASPTSMNVQWRF